MRSFIYVNFFFLVLPFAGCLLSGCKQQASQEEELYAEVMVLHDEVMPLMNTTAKLKNSLDAQLDTLADPVLVQKYSVIKEDLAAANATMMQWMRGFTHADKSLADDEKLEFYQQEKVKMEAIKVQFDEAIMNAENALR